MGIGDIIDEFEVIRITPTAEHMKVVIQKRLESGERKMGVEPGSIIQVTDSAYQAIADITKGSPGLAIEVVMMVMPSAQQLSESQPYVISADQIKKLGLTYQALCEWGDNPLRQCTVLNVKP